MKSPIKTPLQSSKTPVASKPGNATSAKPRKKTGFKPGSELSPAIK